MGVPVLAVTIPETVQYPVGEGPRHSPAGCPEFRFLASSGVYRAVVGPSGAVRAAVGDPDAIAATFLG